MRHLDPRAGFRAVAFANGTAAPAFVRYRRRRAAIRLRFGTATPDTCRPGSESCMAVPTGSPDWCDDGSPLPAPEQDPAQDRQRRGTVGDHGLEMRALVEAGRRGVATHDPRH